MIKTKSGNVAILAVAVFTCVTAAHASLLPVGGAILTPPEPNPGLGIVVGSLVQPFTTPAGVGQYSGTLTTTVIQNDPTNPFAGIGNPNPANHGLTFVYQLHNDAISATSIERMTNIDFTPFLTDVSYQPGIGLPPTSTDRTSAAGVIGWSFTGAPLGLGRLSPGFTSTLMVVQTDAPGFINVLANIIDGSVVQTPTFGPSPNAIGNTPEPSALTLLVLGTIGFARRHRRR
jgi:hypothetical protein